MLTRDADVDGEEGRAGRPAGRPPPCRPCPNRPSPEATGAPGPHPLARLLGPQRAGRASPSPPPDALPGSLAAAGELHLSVDLPAGLTAADLAVASSSSGDQAAEEEEETWEEVGPDGQAVPHPSAPPAAAAGGGTSGWPARARERQKYWSLSHGFRMGRKLGDWTEGEEGVEGGEGEGGAAGGARPPSSRPRTAQGTAPGAEHDSDAEIQAAIAAGLAEVPGGASRRGRPACGGGWWWTRRRRGERAGRTARLLSCCRCSGGQACAPAPALVRDGQPSAR